MTIRRFLLALLSVPLLTNALLAEDAKKPTWQISRTTAPDTVEELKLLQDTVKGVVEKVTPATVAVILGKFDRTREGPQPVGAGSGVIVSADGLVLTAAHVIEPPTFSFGLRAPRQEPQERLTTVRILLPGQIEVTAKILGRNPGVDSGIVKIIDPVPEKANWPGAKEGKWPFVEIGDSTKAQPGQWVVALGHPGGPKPERRAPVRLGQVVSMNAKSTVVISDCALVGGDSGGPLFDLEGKLVGIHSRIGDKLDDNIHVPTKAYQNEWKRLVRGDVVGRESRLGMGIIWTKGSKEPKIDNFFEDSPAEKAGLKANDVLVKLEGHEVATPEEFKEIMSQFRTNDLATVLFRRGDELIETKVKVVREDPNREVVRGVMGVILNREGNNEARIEAFSTDSPAAKAGIQVKDVIVKLNDREVANSDDVDKLMDRLRPNDTVVVAVRRGEEIVEVKVKLVRRSSN